MRAPQTDAELEALATPQELAKAALMERITANMLNMLEPVGNDPLVMITITATLLASICRAVPDVDAAGRAAMVVFVATIKGDVDADT